MSKTKETLFVLVILLVACVLRFFAFGQVPPSPDWDEAALGYNAYSIMETGRDEYGELFPFILRSFDDYKPGLYVYLVMPFIKLFGLTVTAVRLPSAIFGILTVFATYFIVKELVSLSAERTWKERVLPFLTAILFAISPWHVQFSRIGFESNIGLAFNVFAILFFLKGLKRPFLLFLSVLCMGLSLYVYQGEKVFVPLLAFVLIVVFWRQLFSIPKKYLTVAVVFGIIIAFPILSYTITNKAALTRAQGVSVFSEDTPFVKDYANRLIIDKENKDLFGLIVDNRRVAYMKAIVAGYLSHYNLSWLFMSGDIERHHAPQMGLLYLWELPFLLIGFYQLIFGRFNRKMKLLIFLWFFIAPIPAAVTTGVPHAVRTLNFLPTFQIVIAVGVLCALTYVWSVRYQLVRQKIKYYIIAACVVFFIFNFTYFLDQYFVQQNYFYSHAWQYGYKEAVSEVQKLEPRYEKIVVSNKPHMDQSYMFFLFYLSYPPFLYQQEAKNISGGFRENHQFGKYEFRPIEKGSEYASSRVLYVGRPNDFGEGGKLLKIIYFLDGREAIWIVEG